MAAIYNAIPNEELDKQYLDVCNALMKNPGDWDAISMQVLLEIEFKRLGRTLPTPIEMERHGS